jgi:hypothetical protein
VCARRIECSGMTSRPIDRPKGSMLAAMQATKVVVVVELTALA